MSFWDQAPADVRLAEGPDDLAAMLPDAATVVVVDVLSYSTCVAVVVGGGSSVLPLPWRDSRAAEAAAEAGAVLAGPRSLTEPSLSPSSLASLPAGSLLALPSPNGAAATLQAADHAQVFVGCPRNATATAAAITAFPVLLVAAGERWTDGRLRPALEDRIGAGLVAARLEGLGRSLSAEARAAAAIPGDLFDSASARELTGKGYGADVAYAADVDAVAVAAVLVDGVLVGTTRAAQLSRRPGPAARP